MSQDLRELFKKERENKHRMKDGHEERFMELLDNSLPIRKMRVIPRWTIAASILVLLGIGIYFFNANSGDIPANTTIVDNRDSDAQKNRISLGDLSPDLRKIENYYVANINLQLSKLEVSAENKMLVDSFLEQLAELNEEYTRLNQELNNIGPNDQTIAALIQNLQLRLELLYRLKDKISELKSSENEQVESNSI